MLEITSDDVEALNDKDLRGLVGRLCEAELKLRGLSTLAVTWGGHQNAADGGIDVRVRIEDDASISGPIPRLDTGFQVKKTDFTPALISREMRPEGQLRNPIRTLINNRGAYILVSSGSNASDTALNDRLDAMRSAVADENGHEYLHLDFYDRSRLATWVRNYPGLIVWVRQKVGRSISGWQPYSSWAVSPDGVEDEYLLDNKTRLHFGAICDKGLDVTQGIDRIRDILGEVKGVVRLTGLAGVGKTRLVQALFDPRVGNSPLDPALAIYADMTDNPSPQPTGMISDLIASRKRAIVVIDNCAPDLHRRITEVCKAADSVVSVISVEYDVQDDEPEGTKVVRLEPSSLQLVSDLILRHFSAMTQVDAGRIAEFSGGNSRIALALGNTFERHESVAGLRDEELFRRLFHQRQSQDNSLLRAAQACALLYSFEGEAVTGDDAELPKIAALAGTDATQLYAKVAELKRRDLAQSRSVWRAILPHAIANRLAAMALSDIPFELIRCQFDTDRLLRSFSRRLSYLHESVEAKRIVENWLVIDGQLGNLGRLSELGLTIFENIAPVAPEATLAAIETELTGPDAAEWLKDSRISERISRLLRLIAWDASLFERCVESLLQIVIAVPTNHRAQLLQSMDELFHLWLSGTHATIEQRAEAVDRLIRCNITERRSLGLRSLQGLLKNRDFWTNHSPDFGARPVNDGYRPSNREEVQHWFATALQLARRSIENQDIETVSSIRSIVAHSLSDIWFLGPTIQECLEAIAAEFVATGYWQDGWIAVRYLLSHLDDDEKADDAAVERLQKLEISLRPKDVAEEVRAVVMSENRGAINYSEMDSGPTFDSEKICAAREKAFATAEELGKAIGNDEAVFTGLLPDLVTSLAARLFAFGRGLAIGSKNQLSIWRQLKQAVVDADERKRTPNVLQGFLSGLATADQHLCELILDESLTHGVLGGWFPYLQFVVPLTPAGVARLKHAAAFDTASTGTFERLAFVQDIAANDLGIILLSLAKREYGYRSALDILAMRFHIERSDSETIPSELINVGRELLSSADIDFSDRSDSYDRDLSTIANECLRDGGGAIATRKLCGHILQEVSQNVYRTYHFEQLLSIIFETHPQVALDVLFSGDEKSLRAVGAMLSNDGFGVRRRGPLRKAPVEEVIQCCDEDSPKRYPIMAQVAPYSVAEGEAGAKWTPLAIELLKRAPDPVAILQTFVGRFAPISWSGSLATILESRLGLLDSIGELKIPSLESYVAEIRPGFQDKIAQTRRSEDELDSARDERFEW